MRSGFFPIEKHGRPLPRAASPKFGQLLADVVVGKTWIRAPLTFENSRGVGRFSDPAVFWGLF